MSEVQCHCGHYRGPAAPCRYAGCQFFEDAVPEVAMCGGGLSLEEFRRVMMISGVRWATEEQFAQYTFLTIAANEACETAVKAAPRDKVAALDLDAVWCAAVESAQALDDFASCAVPS